MQISELNSEICFKRSKKIKKITIIDSTLCRNDKEFTLGSYGTYGTEADIKNKLEEIDIRLTNLEYQTKKGTKETRQDIETLVEVLEAKGILPKAL